MLEALTEWMPWLLTAACALLLILVVRAFAKVPVQSPAGNCDPVSD